MDLARLKEKLLNLAPLEPLKKLIWSKVFSPAKSLAARFFGGRFSGSSGEAPEDGPSPLAGKKRLILFGLGGAAVLVFGLIITVIVVNITRPKGNGLSGAAAGLPIPTEDLFFPREPDFLPGFLPERERKRFWSLDDIRPYWKAPGNSDWWMERLRTTVDSLMEGVP